MPGEAPGTAVELQGGRFGPVGAGLSAARTEDFNPARLEEKPKEDPNGIFGPGANIWHLHRTREIGLTKGVPRAAARLIVCKNLFDNVPRRYLLKRLPYENPKKLHRFWKEVETHRHVCISSGSDFVVNFYGHRNVVNARTTTDKTGRPRSGSLDYVMEMGSEGDILSFVQNQWKQFSKLRTRVEQKDFLKNHVASTQRIIAQVAYAVSQCFAARIVHFDLKLENVVMTKLLPEDVPRYKTKAEIDKGIEFDWAVKLIDFGLARHFPERGIWLYREGRKGTPRYMAPEIASGNRNIPDARNADIWPIGVMLWECLAGLPLWKEAKRDVKIYSDMLRAKSFKEWFRLLCTMPQNKHFPEFVPKSAVDLLDKIFRNNPAKRADIETILAHPFLADHVPAMSNHPRMEKKGTTTKPEMLDDVPKNDSQQWMGDAEEMVDAESPNRNTLISSVEPITKTVGLYADKDVEAGEIQEELVQQEPEEDLPAAIQRRRRWAARFTTTKEVCSKYFLYGFLLTVYVVAAPFWVYYSGFWELQPYWSVMSACFGLSCILFFYHARRGLKRAPLKFAANNNLSSTIWDVGFKPLITELAFFSTLSVALIFMFEMTDTKTQRDNSERSSTKTNGQFLVGVLVLYRLLSASFFALRYAEKNEGKSWMPTFFSQFVGLRIYRDVERACALRRQTQAIREHKILEGVTNSFVTLMTVYYYYIEKADPTSAEIAWLFPTMLILAYSIALVFSMGDVMAVKIGMGRCGTKLSLFTIEAFRLVCIWLRVGAWGTFASAVSARLTVILVPVELILVLALSYFGLINLQTNRFDFDNKKGKQGRTVQKTIRFVMESIYGMIACPMLHQGKYIWPVKIIHDGFLMFASYQFKKDYVDTWDKPITVVTVFTVWGLFFVLLVVVWFLIVDWGQYNDILKINLDLKEDDSDKSAVGKLLSYCQEQEDAQLLNRLLVSGNLRVQSVRTYVHSNWEAYDKVKPWLGDNGFFELLSDADDEIFTEQRQPAMSNPITSNVQRQKTTKAKNAGKPVTIHKKFSETTPQDFYPSRELQWTPVKAKVLGMSVSPDGKMLAVALEDRPFIKLLSLPGLDTLWQFCSSERRRQRGSRSAYLGAVTGITFRQPKDGGLQIITVSEDAKLRIFNTHSQNPTNEIAIIDPKLAIAKSTFPVRCLTLTPSGDMAAVGYGEKVWFYNFLDARQGSINAHEHDITSLSFATDNVLISGGRGGEVKLHLLADSFMDNLTPMRSGGQQDDEKDALEGDVDGINMPWGNFENKRAVGDVTFSITDVAVSQDGRTIAASSNSGGLMVWEQQDGPTKWRIAGRYEMNVWVDKVDFAAVGNRTYLLSHSRPDKSVGMKDIDGLTAVWDYKSGRCPIVLKQSGKGIGSTCISRREAKASTKLLTSTWSCEDRHQIILWDLANYIGAGGYSSASSPGPASNDDAMADM